MLQIRPLDQLYRDWAAHLLEEQWHGPTVVSRGRTHEPGRLPGFVALLDQQPAGLITYLIVGKECEIVTLNSLVERQGIGTALVDVVKETAVESGCERLWLVTTNDNLPALRFYQKHGFHLARLHPNALRDSRRLKPQIPLTGLDGIPLRDELELEILLGEAVP